VSEYKDDLVYDYWHPWWSARRESRARSTSCANQSTGFVFILDQLPEPQRRYRRGEPVLS
jgi:hypothetical protein